MPLPLLLVLGFLLLFVTVIGIAKISAERSRARVAEALSHEVGLPFARPSTLGLLFVDSSGERHLEGTYEGLPARVTIAGGSTTELRIGLHQALPGNLRIVPRKGRLAARLEQQVIPVPGLGEGVVVLSEDPPSARRLLDQAEVREGLARFFRAHAEARLVSGELVASGPPPGNVGAVRAVLDRMIAVSALLAQQATAAGDPEPDNAFTRAAIELGQGIGAGLAQLRPSQTVAVTEVPTSAPPSIGPIGAEEAAHRAQYGKILARAAVIGLVPMGVGVVLMVANRRGGSDTFFMTGAALLAVGALAYQLLMRCPACGRWLSVWRHFFPSECHHCGLRLQ